MLFEVPPICDKAPLSTLDELMSLTFYEVLGVSLVATRKELNKAFGRVALQFHPDKGGDPVAFAYVRLCYDVLSDPAKRRVYDAEGKSSFNASFRPAAPSADAPGTAPGRSVYEVPAPPINKTFLKELIKMQGSHTFMLNGIPMAQYLEDLLHDRPPTVKYQECALADKIDTKLRLTVTGTPPIYGTPRVLRYAALMGMPVMEIDAPASHGQQVYKYAVKHDLPRHWLQEAFGSPANIVEFRGRVLGAAASGAVKKALNLMCYGNALRDWLRDQHLQRLPAELIKVMGELRGVARHIRQNAPDAWKEAVKGRKHPDLTLMSIQCQVGERVEIDIASSSVPDGVTLHGWLGDSILISRFTADEYLKAMADDNILFTEKSIPNTPAEYFETFKSITGIDFDIGELHTRTEKRWHCYKYAARWLKSKAAWDRADAEERKELKKPPSMPTLDFAIAVEGILCCHMSHASGKMESYDKTNGVWLTGDAGLFAPKGESLSDALMNIFGPNTWRLVRDGPKTRWRMEKGDVPLFHGGALGPIGEMCKYLQVRSDMPALDEGDGAHKLINFKGKYCLDFSRKEPEFDWDDDEQLLAALQSPVRESKPSDRTVRSTPAEFKEYQHADKLELARAIRAVMIDLKDNDVMSDDVARQFKDAASKHTITQKIFVDAHNDINSSFYQLRLCAEPCSDTGFRCQVATMADRGEGCTSKGTLRELMEQCLGVHNGRTQLGYSAVGRQEMVTSKNAEAPSELSANLFLCKNLWIDDFKPQQPLTTAILRQMSGQNNLSAARKGKCEFVYKYRGQVFLACNGLWRPDVAWIGSDSRRHSGLMFTVQYVDNPVGPNQRQKDSSIKENLSAGRAEWWFLVRVFWLVDQPRPKEDHTEPKPPNTLALAMELLGTQSSDFELTSDDFNRFHSEKLMAYVLNLNKPTTSEVEGAFEEWMSEAHPDVPWNSSNTKKVLSTYLEYCPGKTLQKYGTRKRSGVNCYMYEGEIMVRKPRALFSTSEPAMASDSAALVSPPP